LFSLKKMYSRSFIDSTESASSAWFLSQKCTFIFTNQSVTVLYHDTGQTIRKWTKCFYHGSSNSSVNILKVLYRKWL